MQCVCCLRVGTTQLCKSCRETEAFESAWFVGFREGNILRLVDDYKFLHKKEAGRCLAQLLDTSLPYFPPETVVVPVPTISTHVRVRGYDHILEIVSYFARLRQYRYSQTIERNTSTVQQGASVVLRKKQAKKAFKLRRHVLLDSDRPHLVIDDIYTTGSTLRAVTKLLRDAGVRHVIIATILRQPPSKASRPTSK